jgi:hypothetical protein
MVEWVVWREKVDLGPMNDVFGSTDNVDEKTVVLVKWFKGMV